MQIRWRQSQTVEALGPSASSLSSLALFIFLLCAALLMLPAIAAAQCTSQLAVQSVRTEDASGASATTFVAGQGIWVYAEVDNSYGAYLLGANGSQVAITSAFYNDTKSVNIAPGPNKFSWTMAAPANGEYTVTVKAYDFFCGAWVQTSAPLTVGTQTAISNQAFMALAFSPSLKALREGPGATALDAQAVALNACLRYASTQTEYYSDCAPYGWVQGGYIALASSGRAPRELDWAWASGWGATLEEARQKAIQACQSFGGGVPGKAACIMVGGSPFASYPLSTPVSGGYLPPNSNQGPNGWQTAPLPRTDLSVQWIRTDPPIMRITWRNPPLFAQSPPTAIEINNGNETRTVDPTSTSFDWDNSVSPTGPHPRGWMCIHIRATNQKGASWWEPNSPPWYRCAQ